jgi:hypothetical protein
MAWQQARLIPTSGISSDSEAETRATSALLAVLSVVRPFSNAALTPLGASRARNALVETFIETTFKASDGQTLRPDGLVRVTYGKQTPWTALVEVKTGKAKLKADQIQSYLALAKSEGFDCVVTISNEIAPSAGVHPAGVKVRSNSKVALHHLSWTRLLTQAVMIKTHQGVEDPEQAWILGELIRYLEHPASGAMAFDDMGESWKAVSTGARNGTLNRRDDAVADIGQRWDQLLGYASLRLGADIGEDVIEVVPRAQQLDPSLRTKEFAESLANSGTLEGVLRIPDTVGDLNITVDLKARQNIVSVTLDAPTDKGGRGRIGWLVRQLRESPPNLVIEAYAKNARNGIAAPLTAVVEDSSVLIGPDKKDPAKFTLVARSELGMNRTSAGQKPGFTQSVVAAIESFYGDVLQNLTVYQAAAPRLERKAPIAPELEKPVLPSVPLVAVEGPAVSEAIDVREATSASDDSVVIAAPPNWFVSR